MNSRGSLPVRLSGARRVGLMLPVSTALRRPRRALPEGAQKGSPAQINKYLYIICIQEHTDLLT